MLRQRDHWAVKWHSRMCRLAHAAVSHAIHVLCGTATTRHWQHSHIRLMSQQQIPLPFRDCCTGVHQRAVWRWPHDGRLCCTVVAAASVSEEETTKAFLKLQNGSDIRGVAIAGMAGSCLGTKPRHPCLVMAHSQWPITPRTQEDGWMCPILHLV